MKKLILFILFSFLPFYVMAQISNSFFPLEIENKWYYKHSINILGGPPQTILKIANVIDSTTINGKKYFYCSDLPLHSGSWIRFDTISGILFKFDPLNSCEFYHYELLLDSLYSNLNDTVRNCGEDKHICTVNQMQNIFNHQTLLKGFYFVASNTSFSWRYSKYFGLFYYSSTGFGGGGGGSHSFTLIGCKINGVMYGDSVLVSVQKISDIVPEYFNLHQNYPNPFNPVTNIKFSIPARTGGPSTQYTILKVFDIAGREVATLVNEKLQAGSYEFTFDANELSSGVYFYQLKTRQVGSLTDEFVQTRKMVLTK